MDEPEAPTVPEHAFGARVLIVEDNPVNQIVAKESLEHLGCTVALADNGAKAVEAWAGNSFDLILMDLQMPVMDGRDATAAIRARESAEPGRPRTPIVALTANAMVGERERCLAVGMDDYVAKPFTTDQLAAALEKWAPHCRAPAAADDTARPAQFDPVIPPAPRDPGPTPEPRASAELIAEETNMTPADGTTLGSQDQPVLDQAALDAIRALGGAAGTSALTKVIDLYLDYSPTLVGEIEAAIAKEDADALNQAAHSLKSSSASLGAQGFAALCKDLEMIGRNGSIDGAGDIFDKLKGLYPQVCDALTAERGKIAETA
jgi:two-component system sensor histidine kinase/response regulator